METDASQPEPAEAINAHIMAELLTVAGRLTTYNPDFANEFSSVQFGTTREIPDEEHGGSITVTTYQGEGNEEYADLLRERPDFDPGSANVVAYVGIAITQGHLQAETRVFIMSDGRAYGSMDMLATHIPALRTNDSVACYKFLEAFGLEGKWYDFEHAAYGFEHEQGRRLTPFGLLAIPVEINDDTAGKLRDSLEKLLDAQE